MALRTEQEAIALLLTDYQCLLPQPRWCFPDSGRAIRSERPWPETRAFQEAGWFRLSLASRDRLGSPCLRLHALHKRAWMTRCRGWHLRHLQLGCWQAAEETSDRRRLPYSLHFV